MQSKSKIFHSESIKLGDWELTIHHMKTLSGLYLRKSYEADYVCIEKRLKTTDRQTPPVRTFWTALFSAG